MNDDRFAIEFFAAEFGPDESEEKSHEKDDDGFGGIGGDGGHGDGGGGGESGTIGELFGGANNEIGEHGADDFFMASFYNLIPTAMPFGITPDDDEIGEAFAEQNDGDSSNETGVGAVVAADKDEVTNNSDEDIEEGIEDGLDADFAGFFASGEDDDERSCHNNSKA